MSCQRSGTLSCGHKYLSVCPALLNGAILLEILHLMIMDSLWATLPQEVVQVKPTIVTRGRDLTEGSRTVSGDTSSLSSGRHWTLPRRAQERLAAFDQH